MRTFEVTFFYGTRGHSRTAIVEAEAPHLAAVEALIAQKLPAEYIDGEAIWWDRRHYGDRLPEMISEKVIAWGEDDDAHTVVYKAREVNQGEGGVDDCRD